MDISGFHMIRNDRTGQSGKSKGGLAMNVNARWCENICVKESRCLPDIELMTISLRPYYLPREFNIIFITIMYIPPDAKKENAIQVLLDVIARMADSKPDDLQLVFGESLCK